MFTGITFVQFWVEVAMVGPTGETAATTASAEMAKCCRKALQCRSLSDVTLLLGSCILL